MSPPALDGRGFLLKKSCGTPSSPFSKKPGPPSNPDVFTPAPSFTGGCQPKSSCTFSRRETQMSPSPVTPVERFEAKNSRWPSRESAGAKSATELLTVDPRLKGVPHGQLSSAQAENLVVWLAVRFAVILLLGSLPHATSTASGASAMRLRVGGPVIEPPPGNERTGRAGPFPLSRFRDSLPSGHGRAARRRAPGFMASELRSNVHQRAALSRTPAGSRSEHHPLRLAVLRRHVVGAVLRPALLDDARGRPRCLVPHVRAGRPPKRRQRSHEVAGVPLGDRAVARFVSLHVLEEAVPRFDEPSGRAGGGLPARQRDRHVQGDPHVPQGAVVGPSPLPVRPLQVPRGQSVARRARLMGPELPHRLAQLRRAGPRDVVVPVTALDRQRRDGACPGGEGGRGGGGGGGTNRRGGAARGGDRCRERRGSHGRPHALTRA